MQCPLILSLFLFCFFFFFFNDTATTEIYTLSLHDALPIYITGRLRARWLRASLDEIYFREDRKSTRLNSSHRCISYAVFCLKKKTKRNQLLSNVQHKNNATLIHNAIWRC